MNATCLTCRLVRASRSAAFFSLTCSDVDQRVEPLWAALETAKITDKKIGGGEIFFPDYIEPLVRMGEVISGTPNDNSLIAPCDFFVQPLILERNQAACFVEKRRWKCGNYPGTMAVAGMSGPVTIAGTVALSLAELIAGWVLGYLCDPALPVGGIVATASLDMQTMTACFSSPEAILQNVATANITNRLYGIDVAPVTSYTDCKRPGIKAVFDKLLGLLAAPFSLNRSTGTDGLLSAGQDYSPVQHMLDHEISKAVERCWGHFDVNDDTLAVELTESVMRSPSTNFLSTEHTLLNYQSEQWYPKWFDRTPWSGEDKEAVAEPAMLERIDAWCRDAVKRYEQPDIDPGKIRELEMIVDCFDYSRIGLAGFG